MTLFVGVATGCCGVVATTWVLLLATMDRCSVAIIYESEALLFGGRVGCLVREARYYCRRRRVRAEGATKGGAFVLGAVLILVTSGRRKAAKISCVSRGPLG
jgi:hypothetical protein